ncbi:MAG: hypothetical protein Q8937_07545 [Bacteroidota bacterium]|nr:hypothetical protein [Bacteroidota bacterium]
MAVNFFKTAFRNSSKHTTFSFINAMGLTVEMTTWFPDTISPLLSSPNGGGMDK